MELIPQGLLISAAGMGLVFAGLGLLWVLIWILSRIFPGASTHPVTAAQRAQVVPETSAAHEPELTSERARIAALVAGALLSNALRLGMEPPAGPAFEHGRIAPSWVTANRARALQIWQPPRAGEASAPGYDG